MFFLARVLVFYFADFKFKFLCFLRSYSVEYCDLGEGAYIWSLGSSGCTR